MEIGGKVQDGGFRVSNVKALGNPIKIKIQLLSHNWPQAMEPEAIAACWVAHGKEYHPKPRYPKTLNPLLSTPKIRQALGLGFRV